MNRCNLQKRPAAVISFPGLCNGSTRDFESLSLGSNPSPGVQENIMKPLDFYWAVWFISVIIILGYFAYKLGQIDERRRIKKGE